jgi:hypothetical protein
MEVHHHSHTPRKKWAHYFWEFFMLFLAVTLGFFVENQREHMVEHRREKQYIKSMIVDLETDTVKLNAIMQHHGEIMVGLDSIMMNYEQFSTGRYTPAFFRFERSLFGFTDFIYTDRTIDQLKSSGGMRLIRKQDASDSIISYDDWARDFLLEQEGLQRILNRLSEQQYDLINYRYVITQVKKDRTKLITDPSADILLTHDPVRVEGFFNTIRLYYQALSSKIIEADTLKQRATRLIAFLKKRYHLS